MHRLLTLYLYPLTLDYKTSKKKYSPLINSLLINCKVNNFPVIYHVIKAEKSVDTLLEKSV